jgi:hypothetical protein
MGLSDHPSDRIESPTPHLGNVFLNRTVLKSLPDLLLPDPQLETDQRSRLLPQKTFKTGTRTQIINQLTIIPSPKGDQSPVVSRRVPLGALRSHCTVLSPFSPPSFRHGPSSRRFRLHFWPATFVSHSERGT